MTAFSMTGLINPATGLLDSKYREGAPPANYTPLVNINLRGLANGATPPIFGNGATVSTDYGQEGRSIKVITNPTQVGVTCGTHFFAGRQTLPVAVPLGKTVWQRMKFRFPAAFSFGYTYGAGAPSTPAADGCSANADGGPTAFKFMVFSPNVGTGRIYYNASNSLRSIAQNSTSGVLAMEASPDAQQLARKIFPRDQVVTCEVAVKVAHDNTGYARVWVDEELLAEAVNVRTIQDAATAISEFGVGDYWNGTPWTDGVAGRNVFYVDEILVASDIDGYGAPSGRDSADRPMIGSEIRNRDF